MDWRAEAIGKLRGYEANKRRLEETVYRCPVSELGTFANPQAPADFPPHGSDGGMAPAGYGERPAPIYTAGVGLEALELEQARLWVAMVDNALEVLDPDGRLVLEALYIRHAPRESAACGRGKGRILTLLCGYVFSK